MSGNKSGYRKTQINYQMQCLKRATLSAIFKTFVLFYNISDMIKIKYYHVHYFPFIFEPLTKILMAPQTENRKRKTVGTMTYLAGYKLKQHWRYILHY